MKIKFCIEFYASKHLARWYSSSWKWKVFYFKSFLFSWRLIFIWLSWHFCGIVYNTIHVWLQINSRHGRRKSQDFEREIARSNGTVGCVRSVGLHRYWKRYSIYIYIYIIYIHICRHISITTARARCGSGYTTGVAVPTYVQIAGGCGGDLPLGQISLRRGGNKRGQEPPPVRQDVHTRAHAHTHTHTHAHTRTNFSFLLWALHTVQFGEFCHQNYDLFPILIK